MSQYDQIEELIQYFNGLSERFVSGSDGFFLQTDDQAECKGKVIEATALLDELFGEGNTYTSNIIHTANTKSGGFIGGPSLACVKEIDEILIAATKQIQRQSVRTDPPDPERQYVALSRIAELQAAKSPKFDLSRLIRLCEELNCAHGDQCLMSILFLVRALIDHVPPLFGARTFSEIGSNYAGSKSFGAAMRHLDKSLRNAADSHLHVQIRSRETLPTFQQVDFKSDLDTLLAEVVRILAQKAPSP